MLGITLIVLAAVTVPPATAGSVPEEYQRVALCSVLEAIRPGEVIPVVVTGVFEVDYEYAAFFDPDTPNCNLNVQPATWVELSPMVVANAELNALLEKSRRALVTFKGQLHGPGVVLPDDPSIPFAAALARRMPKRYGHLNAYRTKLVVEAVLHAAPVLDSIPWEWGGKPLPSPAVTSPIHLGVPEYPAAAREQGITGEVVVQVTVFEGVVTVANVISGDRALVAQTVSNVRTWHFDIGVSTSFTTAFMYQLERRKAGDEQPRIELHLPQSVMITAARYDW